MTLGDDVTKLAGLHERREGVVRALCLVNLLRRLKATSSLEEPGLLVAVVGTRHDHISERME
jgi:hypothetical protein